MADRFLILYTPGAVKELRELDGSVKPIVAKYLKRLAEEANHIGKPLRNDKDSRLAGCRELKLKQAGIRILYMITGEKVEVIGVTKEVLQVLAVGKRAEYDVFKDASKRLEEFAAPAVDDSQTLSASHGTVNAINKPPTPTKFGQTKE
ncbi:mRNA interferase RelE/StbE [Hydrogenispora ethanolica]|uniref:mRNA interferase RelE/StbE n=1 Tax=Hydrogenispora ethanolica TaxID=1082276 RepID=A0A4R1SB66_HYDET|nr:type II toxin-antitoxin system RelE/ParE family toxin [Hydrogenispora ethanolica]TCL76494.1 mRNA interferase RelE/StbE [Hydrogenispora ethanolica]